MSSLQTFILLSKAFCGLEAMLVPINFEGAGWLGALLLMLAASFCVWRACSVTITCFKVYEVRDIMDLVEMCFGVRSKWVASAGLVLF